MREILLGAVGVLALALVLSVSTCRWERGKHDDTRDKLAAERAQVSACATALDAVNAVTAEAVADGARREQAVREAAQAALQAAREAEGRAREARRALAESRRDPTCAEQLEVKLCAAIPLL